VTRPGAQGEGAGPEEIPIDIDAPDQDSSGGTGSSPAATVVVTALDDALSKSMSLVELDQYATRRPSGTGLDPIRGRSSDRRPGHPSPLRDPTTIPESPTYRATGVGGLRPSLIRASSAEPQAGPAANAALASVPSGERSAPPDSTGI